MKLKMYQDKRTCLFSDAHLDVHVRLSSYIFNFINLCTYFSYVYMYLHVRLNVNTYVYTF